MTQRRRCACVCVCLNTPQDNDNDSGEKIYIKTAVVIPFQVIKCKIRERISFFVTRCWPSWTSSFGDGKLFDIYAKKLIFPLKCR